MSLQAYFDDSGSDTASDNFFVLAGYITTVAKWAKFSDEWQACLDRSPGAAYFKSTEAMHLRGEFRLDKGWTRELRDERVVELAHIIWRHCPIALSAVVRHQDFADTIATLPMFSGEKTISNRHPYTFLWYHLLSEIWLNGHTFGLGKGPCDCIFDKQLGFEAEAYRFWQTLEEAMGKPPVPPWFDWIGSAPIFRDDKNFLPLQAADLLAWANRRALASPDDLKLPDEAIERLNAISSKHLDFRREFMVQQSLQAAALMLGAASSAKERPS